MATSNAGDTETSEPTSEVPGARLAEEARLLLDALAERAQPWLNRLAADPGEDGAPHTPATCGWCPICAGLALLRGERPELAVRAAEHAAGLLAVLRAALAEPAGPPRPDAAANPTGEPEGEPGSEPGSEPKGNRVQHIEVRRRPADGEQD